MERLFITCIDLSITASMLILAVFLLRTTMKCILKRMICFLWILAGMRLMFPVSPVSVFSLVPRREALEPVLMLLDRSEKAFSFQHPQTFSLYPTQNTAVSMGTDFRKISLWAGLWLIGAVLIAGLAFVQYGRLKKRVRTAIRLQNVDIDAANYTATGIANHTKTGTANLCAVYQSEEVSSPFVMGIFCPRIYLPCRMNKEDLPYVLAHEKSHIQRYDHLLKIAGFFILALHWFNPIVWLWFILFGKDMEMACDERVIRSFSLAERQNYSMALLHCCGKRNPSFSCPPGFGGSDIKKRIKAIMNYRIPTRRLTFFSAGLCGVVFLCFMTDPMNIEGKSWFKDGDMEIFGIEQYTLPEDFPGYSKLDIFPQKLPEKVIDGQYHYLAKDMLFDPTIQMVLSCTYSEEAYKKERARISNIQETYQGQVKKAVYDEKRFPFPAYVTVYAHNHCYEYALFPGNQRIIYIFLQFAKENELIVEPQYLPLSYHGNGENNEENGESIYVFQQKDGTGICLY